MKQPTVTKKKRTLANGGKVSQVPGLNNNIVYRIYKHEAGDRSESTLDLLSDQPRGQVMAQDNTALIIGALALAFSGEPLPTEIPGIIVGLLLARRAVDQSHSAIPAPELVKVGAGTPGFMDSGLDERVMPAVNRPGWTEPLREVLTGPSVLLLVGGGARQ